MRKEMKQWLTLHKGKVLNTEMINMIARHSEDELLDIMYNEGFVLESLESGDIITTGENKNYAVQSYDWKTIKEFSTMMGAINFARKQKY